LRIALRLLASMGRSAGGAEGITQSDQSDLDVWLTYSWRRRIAVQIVAVNIDLGRQRVQQEKWSQHRVPCVQLCPRVEVSMRLKRVRCGRQVRHQKRHRDQRQTPHLGLDA
jgi:hypothetical protein